MIPTDEQIDGAVHALAALIFPDDIVPVADSFTSAGGLADKVTVQVIRHNPVPINRDAQQETQHGILSSSNHPN